MKNIVLYTMVLIAGLFMFSTETTGQKTTIDLLPSAHQRIQPEAREDTSFLNDSLVRIAADDRPSSVYSIDEEKKSIYRKESLKTGFQIDSFFQKRDRKSNSLVKRSGHSLLNLKYFNPIKLIIYITALKR